MEEDELKQVFDKILRESHFTEKRIDATNEDLELLRTEARRNKDSELYKNLFTRIGKNPRYKYFARPDDYNITTATLSSIIQVSINDEDRGFVPFFIVDNLNNFIGFISYIPDDSNPRIIREIKAFNFSEKPSITMAKDVLNLIDDLINEYDEVHWSALYGNTAVRSYNHYLQKKGLEGYIVYRNPSDDTNLKEYDQISYSIMKK
jgi:hypothetical protein